MTAAKKKIGYRRAEKANTLQKSELRCPISAKN
jgi:hypothetical protein